MKPVLGKHDPELSKQAMEQFQLWLESKPARTYSKANYPEPATSKEANTRAKWLKKRRRHE